MSFPKFTCLSFNSKVWGALAGLGAFIVTEGYFALKCMWYQAETAYVPSNIGEQVAQKECDLESISTWKLMALALATGLAVWQVMNRSSFFAGKSAAVSDSNIATPQPVAKLMKAM